MTTNAEVTTVNTIERWLASLRMIAVHDMRVLRDLR